MNNPHAVRWTRKNTLGGKRIWSPWHWTDDGELTLCGQEITYRGPIAESVGDRSRMEGKQACATCGSKLDMRKES